jgi:2-phospho-L-lactate guanylyltransferase
MLVAIVPVKPLEIAKGRLAGLLTAPERRALVLAMLGDVLAALCEVPNIARIGVISADPTVLARAGEIGADQLRDTAADLNAALAQAAGYYATQGATAALILPADVPLATPSEISQLIAALPAGQAVALAPAGDGGTNAMLVRPPLALPFLFGAGSLARHVGAARDHGLAVECLRSPGLSLDVDRPDDLLALAELDGATQTQRLAHDLCVYDRMMCV